MAHNCLPWNWLVWKKLPCFRDVDPHAVADERPCLIKFADKIGGWREGWNKTWNEQIVKSTVISTLALAPRKKRRANGAIRNSLKLDMRFLQAVSGVLVLCFFFFFLAVLIIKFMEMAPTKIDEFFHYVGALFPYMVQDIAYSDSNL